MPEKSRRREGALRMDRNNLYIILLFVIRMQSKIKAIIFDLDGVLVDARTLHYEAFRQAFELLCPPHTLKWKEHEELYDGLSTRQKLQKMMDMNILSKETAERVSSEKQRITNTLIEKTVRTRPYLINLLRNLQSEGYILVCATNSIRETLNTVLETIKISEYFSFTLSNNDVENPKPSSEIYSLSFKKLGLLPDQCLICEDSPHGRKAAYSSGAHVLEIEDAHDLTLEKIHQKIKSIQDTIPNIHPTIQIVIPMAGEGSRFQKAGYTIPKPFIDVRGKHMIQWVIDNVTSSKYKLEFVFLCREKHLETNSMSFLDVQGLSYKIIHVKTLTEGAACTVLLAKDVLNPDLPMVIVNSDQYLEWNTDSFYSCLLNPSYDGVISTFYSPDPSDTKWSFIELDENMLITKVAEKVWLGPNATTGIYGWKRASDFISYTERMIQKNIRVNNEFYVCPVYNEAIEDSKKIRYFECKKLWGLGVPSDLEYFLSNYN
jgi:HAD superfamily hydrolase (TIGR01509 family)